MKYLLYSSVLLVTIAFASSCRKKVEACADFNQDAYIVNDTIYLNASCSENADTYSWKPQAGLQMIGTGNSSTEQFVILPLTGSLSRTIELTVSNSKSSRTISKSVVVI